MHLSIIYNRCVKRVGPKVKIDREKMKYLVELSAPDGLVHPLSI